MAKKNNSSNTYPWYDDRSSPTVDLHPFAAPDGEDLDPVSLFDEMDEDDDELAITSPKEIYSFLDQRVWKQEEAKRAAAMLAFNALTRGIRQNAFFVGPTGCGKTHIWRCLQELFPGRIAIVDASHVTNDGWKGSVKWTDLLSDPMFRYEQNTILVMDEADKFLAPKFTSHGENVSQTVAGEGLKLIEGTTFEITSNRVNYVVDTSHISFVLCGAFSVKADQIARSQSARAIGFDQVRKEVKAYSRGFTEEDLINYGVLPELVGRFQRVVNLEPMTEEDYFRMTASSCGPIDRIEQQYHVDIHLTEAKRRELAAVAYRSGLGVRGMENSIRRLVDDALFEDCTRRVFEF